MGSVIQKIASAGLISKGIVYCLIGLLAFTAAFEIGRDHTKNGKRGVFDFVQEQTGGKIILALIAIGLLCYCIWRFVQTFSSSSENSQTKKIAKKIRYFWSGLIYLSVAFIAVKMVFNESSSGGGNSNQQMVGELLSKPFGQWLVGIVAVFIAGVGIYQCYYGLSEKYKDHVSKISGSSNATALLRAGKAGYVARGIVWLIISWLLLKAAFNANASEAGDTAKAFRFVESSSYGSYLLGILALGLICYGIFNFIRAKYERFS